MIPAGDLRDRVTLERFDLAAGDWAAFASRIPAAVEPLGEQRFLVRIRYRDDLTCKADMAPAMRALVRGRWHDVDDVVEVERGVETHVKVSGRLIESEDLASGTRRIQTWP